MSTRNRTPPLLEAYLQLPTEASQLLLTGVLDASPQWLVTRLLRSALSPETNPTSSADEEKQEDVAVVLVSWMRDWEFWKGEARRGAGLDLARLAQQKRFAFVDGLTNLFPITTSQSQTPSSVAPRSLPIRNTPTSPIPNRGSPLPSRNPIPPRNPAPTPQSQPQTPQPQTQQPSTTTTLTDPSLASAENAISTAISTLTTANPSTRILLILDSPTLLLATSPTPNFSTLSSFLLSLRQKVHSTALVLETDSPLLDAARPDSQIHPTPLEAAHAAFVVQQAHVSRWVLALRPLDTGRARDVSGVVRVSRGGAYDEDEEEGDTVKAKELEALYFVQADGGVRVFERGEASVG